MTVEVHTWEPNANSGKPLLCLHEKQVPFVHRYVDMGRASTTSPRSSRSTRPAPCRRWCTTGWC